LTTTSRIADVRRAVEALSGELADRAHEMDQVRRLPADLAHKMASTGIFRIVTPKSLGGFEASAKEVVELLEQVAVSNASAGWCAMIAGTSCLKAAYLAPDVAQLIYADPNNISGGVFAPMGRADIEGDSFRVNGRWQWGSVQPTAPGWQVAAPSGRMAKCAAWRTAPPKAEWLSFRLARPS
jgi:alkylation response protein AidB-like acyl-CoA dehydrogenase